MTREELDEKLRQQREYWCSTPMRDRMQIMGFVPTSTGSAWRGKYRCNFCTATGYPGYHNNMWWGHAHGVKCKKNLNFWEEWIPLNFLVNPQ